MKFFNTERVKSMEKWEWTEEKEDRHEVKGKMDDEEVIVDKTKLDMKENEKPWYVQVI